jgi:hypothetical protein
LRQPRWMTELPRVSSPGRRWSPIVGEHEPRDWSAIFRFKQRMASLWVSPAATLVLHEARPRLARMRTWVSAMMCSARLVWRPRLGGAGVLAWRRPPRWGPRRPQVQTEAFYPRVLSGAPSSAVSGNRCKVHLFPLAGGFRWRSEVQSARDGLNELGDDHLRQPISDWARTDGFHWPA